jgi:hypothetical protein
MILVQFYHMQDPCLNCAPKNLKFRMFVCLIIQTKFQHVEINFAISSSNSWVMDSGAGAHICSNMQALKRSRRLEKGEMQLKFGNGALVAAIAVGD